MIRHFRFTYLLIAAALSSMIWSLSKGSTSIPFDQLLFSKNELFNTVLWSFRLPRTLSAFTVGGLLALSGMLTQLLLKNPLADPYVLGISSGAALFTLLLMLFGFSGGYLLAGAWSGSLFTILLILLLAKNHRWQTPYLLLSGIAISFAFSALITCILLMSPDKNLHSMLFWLAGDLSNARMPWLEMTILIAALVACYQKASGLDILGRGEHEARLLGLAYQRYRYGLFLLSALLTACAVTLAGCVGFIGLIIPHLTRQVIGMQHRYALPCAVLFGGSLLTIADTIARSVFAPLQLPVGMIMALLGAPVFIFLLWQRKTLGFYLPATHDAAITPASIAPIVLSVKDASIVSGNGKRICESANFQLNPGEIWGILGMNGCGKTTLLHTLAQLYSLSAGNIFLNNVNCKTLNSEKIARTIALLLQQQEMLFPQSVFDYCLAARYPHTTSDLENRNIVKNALKTMDLLSLQHKNILEISGGEKRRAAIACVLAQTPSIYLLDEPTNHLDISHQHQLLQHLQDLAINQSATIVMSLHDLNMAEKYCTHLMLLSHEGILCDNKQAVMTENALSNLYHSRLQRLSINNLVYWQAKSDIINATSTV